MLTNGFCRSVHQNQVGKYTDETGIRGKTEIETYNHNQKVHYTLTKGQTTYLGLDSV